MQLHQIHCAKCRTAYDRVDVGCGICGKAKKNLLLPETPEAVRPEDTLEELASQSLRLLRLNLERLEREMLDAGNLFSKEHASQSAQLARAMATIVGEARKLEESRATQAAQMSFEDKCRYILEYISALPTKELQSTLVKQAVALLEGSTAQEAELEA